MVVLYEEMAKMHHNMAPNVTIQTHSKEMVSMLRDAMTTLGKIDKWYEKYPEALAMVPRKDWITMKNSMVQLCIKV